MSTGQHQIRRGSRLLSLSKGSRVQSFLFLLVLSSGVALAQETSDKGSGGFWSLGVPDGTNGVYMPRLVYSPKAVYTDAARRKKIQGLVLIGLVVNQDGTTSELRVVGSLDPDLDREAVKAVANWRFKPGTKNGHPVAMRIAVEVSFRLDTR